MQLRRPKDTARPEGAAEGTVAATDLNGWNVWRLAKPRIIRRPIASPNNRNQSFYYNLLLKHVSTRESAELSPPDRDYFKQCVRQEIFTTKDELDKLLQAHGAYHLWTDVNLERLKAVVADAVQRNNVEVLGAVDADMADNPQVGGTPSCH